MVERLQREFPNVSARLLVTGEPPYPHAKVFSLVCLLREARYNLIVMADSDIRVTPDFCRIMAAEQEAQPSGVVSCAYRAIAGRSLWSRLEALGMNTDFHAGVLTAVMLEGMKFAMGPTLMVSRIVLDAIGGMERVKDFLSSEDFMLGHIAAAAGFPVRLSTYVVEHRIGSETMRENISHRLRWARTSRRSRPAGYVGQVFTFPLLIALVVLVAWPRLWPFVVVTVLLRALAAWSVSSRVLAASVNWLLLPLQDVLGFGFWMAGFFGNTIEWRGRRYRLNRDGTARSI
jgi:ceramide glucosyltransferase